jgi:hypothetical protein
MFASQARQDRRQRAIERVGGGPPPRAAPPPGPPPPPAPLDAKSRGPIRTKADGVLDIATPVSLMPTGRAKVALSS